MKESSSDVRAEHWAELIQRVKGLPQRERQAEIKVFVSRLVQLFPCEDVRGEEKLEPNDAT